MASYYSQVYSAAIRYSPLKKPPYLPFKPTSLNNKKQPSQWPKLETIYLNQIKEASGDIIILPETILPTVIHKRPWLNTLQTISNQKNKTIVLGSFIHDAGTYNGSIIIQPHQSPLFYKKQRLMPFGETLPFPKHIIKDHSRPFII